MYSYKVGIIGILLFLGNYTTCYSSEITKDEFILAPFTKQDEFKVEYIIREDSLYLEQQSLIDYLELAGLDEVASQLQGKEDSYIGIWELSKILDMEFIVDKGVFYFYHEDETMNLKDQFQIPEGIYGEELVDTKEDIEIPTLMYHLCMDTVPEGLGGMAVTPERFEEQLVALKEAGYTTITFEEYYAARVYNVPLPQKPVIISFDDGYENNYTHAFPILEKHNMKATIFINPYTVDYDMGTYSHLTWDQLREMEASELVSIQSHAYEHKSIRQMSSEDITYSVEKGFERIEDELGSRKNYVFSYPMYSYNERTIRQLSDMGIHMQVIDLGDVIDYEDDLSRITRQRVSEGTTGSNLLQTIK